jgi:hypothetical protein
MTVQASGLAAGPLADLVARLLDLTQRQLAAAGRGDWEIVLALLDQRAPLAAAVADLKPTGLDAAARARLAATITTVLDLDRQLAHLMRANQAAIRHELARVRQGRRLLGAYSGAPGHDAGQLLDRPS